MKSEKPLGKNKGEDEAHKKISYIQIYIRYHLEWMSMMEASAHILITILTHSPTHGRYRWSYCLLCRNSYL